MRVPSTDVQNNFGRYLKYVEAREEVIVTRNGKDIAKIVPFDEMDQLKERAAEYHTSGEWVTYEEFLELVDNSEQRFELIDGVVYNLAAPSVKHQWAVKELFGTFYIWFKGKTCAPFTSPFDVTFFKEENNICVVQPDLIVVCDHENTNDKDKYMGTPTLVVEVLSPSTRNKDLAKKLDLYQRCCVKEYWIVDPMNESVEVYAYHEGEIKDRRVYTGDAEVLSIHFQGLMISLKELFSWGR